MLVFIVLFNKCSVAGWKHGERAVAAYRTLTARDPGIHDRARKGVTEFYAGVFFPQPTTYAMSTVFS